MKKITFIALILVLGAIILSILHAVLLNCDGRMFGWIFSPLAILLGLVLAIIARIKEKSVLGQVVATGTITLAFICLVLLWVAGTSLSAARIKSREAHVAATLSSLRAVAHEDTTPGFGFASGSCQSAGSIFKGGRVPDLIQAVQEGGATPKCFSNSQAWAVSAVIPQAKKGGLFCSQTNNYSIYCVDSAGFSGRVTQEAVGPVCVTI